MRERAKRARQRQPEASLQATTKQAVAAQFTNLKCARFGAGEAEPERPWASVGAEGRPLGQGRLAVIARHHSGSCAPECVVRGVLSQCSGRTEIQFWTCRAEVA